MMPFETCLGVLLQPDTVLCDKNTENKRLKIPKGKGPAFSPGTMFTLFNKA